MIVSLVMRMAEAHNYQHRKASSGTAMSRSKSTTRIPMDNPLPRYIFHVRSPMPRFSKATLKFEFLMLAQKTLARLHLANSRRTQERQHTVQRQHPSQTATPTQNHQYQTPHSVVELDQERNNYDGWLWTSQEKTSDFVSPRACPHFSERAYRTSRTSCNVSTRPRLRVLLGCHRRKLLFDR